MVEQDARDRIKARWSSVSTHPMTRPGDILAGRSMAIMSGWFIMTLGAVLTITICGAVIGIPLFAFGFLLMARGLFEDHKAGGCSSVAAGHLKPRNLSQPRRRGVRWKGVLVRYDPLNQFGVVLYAGTAHGLLCPQNRNLGQRRSPLREPSLDSRVLASPRRGNSLHSDAGFRRQA